MAVNLYEQHRPREATITVSRDPDYSGDFVCDGTADNVEIQAAIDYVTALGTGGLIHIKAGEYLIATRLTIVTSYITIQGEAKGWRDGTYLHLTGGDTQLFHLGNGANTYENIFIWHMELRGTDAVNEVGIYTEYRVRFASFKYLEFLNFNNASAHCMDFTDLARSEIIRCDFKDCDGGHIVAAGTGADTENVYERNQFAITSNWNIDIGGGTSINKIIGNYFEHGDDGGAIRITAGGSNIIALNISHFHDGSDDLDLQTDHNKVIGNYFININVISGDENIIDGNRLGTPTLSGDNNRWSESNITSNFTDAGINNELPTYPMPFIQGTTFISADGSAKGWEINAEADMAVALGQLPINVQQVVRIKIWAVALGAPPGSPGNMHLDILFNAGGSLEAYNLAANSWTLADFDSEEADYVNTNVIHWVIEDGDVGTELANLLGGDSLELKVNGALADAPDGETNATFRVIEIEYV